MKETLNKYKNKKNGEIKEIWETKRKYENHEFKFDEDWEQI